MEGLRCCGLLSCCGYCGRFLRL